MLKNKYTKWYNLLIDNAKRRNWSRNNIDFYVEKHHIKPKCCGGNDDNKNLVLLTAREHYVAHLLLTKMYTGNKKYSLYLALFYFNMNPSKKNARYKMSSRLYEYSKKCLSEAVKTRNAYKRSHGLFNIKHSEETKQKIREARAKQVIPNTIYEKNGKHMRSLLWINDGKINKRVHKDNVNEYLNSGYKLGRLSTHITKEYKKKLSDKTKNQWKEVKKSGHTGNLIKI